MFVSERGDRDYSANGFRARGWDVAEREYGTKTMAEMFTLLDRHGGIPAPPKVPSPREGRHFCQKTVYEEGDSYIRLSNLYCYDSDPIGHHDRISAP